MARTPVHGVWARDTSSAPGATRGHHPECGPLCLDGAPVRTGMGTGQDRPSRGALWRGCPKREGSEREEPVPYKQPWLRAGWPGGSACPHLTQTLGSPRHFQPLQRTFGGAAALEGIVTLNRKHVRFSPSCLLPSQSPSRNQRKTQWEINHATPNPYRILHKRKLRHREFHPLVQHLTKG